MDFPQSLSEHMPEKSNPIAHNGKQNVLVYSIWQNLLKFLQGDIIKKHVLLENLFSCAVFILTATFTKHNLLNSYFETFTRRIHIEIFPVTKEIYFVYQGFTGKN